ncbi:phage tail tape measure protein [Streptomyces sp. NBC_00247]|uniref:phage tail tape measure protein n=1 Tax=Streptomyces sp. NBC_00247 TaxID=2975689 RepID=UPI002E29821C|nr:phage tail tape measure protein [Streptomyces sp. NBC_00247]
MPVEVGVGYVSVVPSTRGFGSELQRQISGPSADAGQRAGRESGQGFLGGIGGVLKTGIAGVAATAGALFAVGFTEAVAQDKSNARLGAQLGLSAKESARLGKVAGKVFGKGYGESIDQVNDALRGLAQNGVAAVNAPKKDLAELTKSALNLADTFDAEVGESAKAAGQLIKTGLAKDGKQAFDLITAGFQSGADKSGDFLDTLNEYGTQFRKAGLGGAASIGLISQALEAGARDGDLAADAIKEFTIRVVDGSKTTADGYKLLGLSSATMAKEFAKGGASATAALDLTLDKLRAIPDPVKQNAAAVALFGTQSEDLGAALYAMDPSSAADKLGKVGGAATTMGKALHATATNDFDVFKRMAVQKLADTADKYVLPAVARLGSFLISDVVPTLRTFGAGVRTTGEALGAGVDWLREYGAWLLPLAVGIAGLTITMNASAIATGAVTAVFSVYRGVILATAAVTRGYAIAQGVLNAVMSANPIGLIITGVAALAALIFVAYKRSDTFRSIVQATWSGIQSGWSSLWSVLQPGIAGFMTGLRAIGTGAAWLWGTVLAPTFGFIGTAAKVLGVVVATLLIAPFVIGFKAVGAIASWLWDSQIKPVFEDIATGAVWLWGSALQPVFGWIWSGLRATGAGATWLYRNAIKPAFDGIGTGAGWLWGSAIKPAFDGIGAGAAWLWGSGIKPAFTGIQSGVRMTGSVATWLYRSAVKPAFDGIGTGAAWLWNVALRPVLDKGRAGVKLFGAAFGLAKDAIGSAWSQIKNIAKEPVNFIIKHIYTEGIKATWDKVAGFVGVGKMPAAPKLLAGGGRTHGGVPGKDSIPTLMMADEFVVKRSSARAVGFDTLSYINEHGELPVQRFADGGIVGDLWGAAKKVGGTLLSGADFLTDPGKMWDKATGFIRDKAATIGSSPWAQALGRFPAKMLDGLKDKIVNAAGSMFGGASGSVGGSGVERWSSVVLQALKMVGQPASLLPVVLRRMNQESGGNPRAINNWDINAKNGDPSRGLMQTIGATFNAYAGPLQSRGIYDPLANVVASMRYALSRYGSLASAYNRPGGYADGGRPKRGELAWVGERGPELVRFGGGDTEVYDHLTSLRMAGGLGVLRGFAKGTKVSASTKARREVPADLAAFRKSLTGTAAQIAAASNALAADLKSAGGAGKNLATATTAASAKLQALAKQRDTVASKIATAKAAATDQATSATDYLGLGNISDPTSVGGLISGLQARQSTLASFQARIATASKRGVSQSLISQLVAAGPDSQLARLVSGASAGQIKQLNALAASGSKLSTAYGRTMADAMYDAGTMAGKGFLTGLQAQEAALQKEMTKLGGTLVTTIERRLQIHSPSRETDRVGRMVGAGLIGGMVSTLPAIDRASVRMATASVPAPAAAIRTAAQPAGLQQGQQLALVLADGTQLDAYVDTRVDAGMTTVRQRSRAGAR